MLCDGRGDGSTLTAISLTPPNKMVKAANSMFCKSWNLRTELEEQWEQLQEDMGLRGFVCFLNREARNLSVIIKGEELLPEGSLSCCKDPKN